MLEAEIASKWYLGFNIYLEPEESIFGKLFVASKSCFLNTGPPRLKDRVVLTIHCVET